jgi:hypothetical protein
VCDKTAAALAQANPEQIIITPATWHYRGDGCC